MRFFIVIMVITILMGLFFIALDNMGDYGISSLILAGVSIFALYRVFKYLFEGGKAKNAESLDSDDWQESHNLIDYMIFGDIASEADADEREE